MSKKKYNPTTAQERAIEFSGADLLVSAGAGSGKTTTLADRIKKRIVELHEDISRKLIVTFTKESANDLRAKLNSSLSEILASDPSNDRIASQVIKLGGADICTIDAFYLKIVRENFEKLGIEGGFRMADESERAVLCTDAMGEVIDELFEQDEYDADFISVRECFGRFSSEETLKEGLLKLYVDLCATENGIETLLENKFLTGDMMDTAYGKILRQSASDTFSHLLKHYEREIPEIEANPLAQAEFGEAFQTDRDFIKETLSVIGKGNYAQIGAQIAPFKAKAKKSIKGDKPKLTEDEVKEYNKKRSTFKGALAEYKVLFTLSEDELNWTFAENRRMCGAIYKVLLSFEERYTEKKKSAGVRDFNDVTRYAMELLCKKDGTPTELAEQIAEKYDEIYVDEYQDTNLVQDKIFRAISRNNRFLVGDIKQSIYMFRAANPDIFSGYRRSLYPLPVDKETPVPPIEELEKAEGFTGAQIAMRENFRCAKGIINFSNAVSSCMFEGLESIPYKRHEDELVFSGGEFDEAHPVPEVYLIDGDGAYLDGSDEVEVAEQEQDGEEQGFKSAEEVEEEEEAKGVPLEAEFVSAKIQQLIAESAKESEAEQSKDKRDKKLIRAKDITILLRSFTYVDEYRNALAKRGIKSTYRAESRFFEKSEILLALCVLNAIDNPLRDAYLAGAMRSCAFAFGDELGFSLDELIKIKTEKPGVVRSCGLYRALAEYKGKGEDGARLEGKIAEFRKRLDGYRRECRALSCAEALSFVYSATGMIKRATKSERQSLLKLYDMARSYDAGKSKGLYGFLRYVEGIKDGKGREDIGDVGEDAVRIMTVHGSKGLEFKACFVCSCGTAFNLKDRDKDIIFTNKLGVNTYVFPTGGLLKYDTVLRKIAQIAKVREIVEEEMRMLYVAMTRAKSRLFITGRAKSAVKYKESVQNGIQSAYSMLKAGSYMNWILRAMHENEGVARLELVGKKELDELKARLEGDAYQINFATEQRVDTQERVNAIKARLAFEYPHSHLGSVPSKLSVSELEDYKKRIQSEKDGVPYESSDDSYNFDDEPSFEGVKAEASGAEKGTATHVFLQFCSFDRLSEENGVENELARLIEEKYISKEMGALVEKEHIEAFVKSDLYKNEIKNAKRVWQELRFNVMLNAEEIAEGQSGEILVQGVCDLVIEDGEGKIVLVDYKTDRIKAEKVESELKKRYSTQLEYYKKACKKMFGRIDRVLIYSTPHGVSVRV